MDELDDAPKKTKKEKKKAVKKAAVAVAEEVVDESTQWKGKPSSFFVLAIKEGEATDPSNPNNFELNTEQWNFIFKYYPEYGAGPYDLMVWIHQSAQQHEAMYSGKPVLGGRTAGGEGDDEEDFDSIMGKKGGKIDKGFGKTQGNKESAAKKAK